MGFILIFSCMHVVSRRYLHYPLPLAPPSPPLIAPQQCPFLLSRLCISRLYTQVLVFETLMWSAFYDDRHWHPVIAYCIFLS